ncbi:hypothetical protein ACM25O_14410 [Sulfitobacter pontiacus]
MHVLSNPSADSATLIGSFNYSLFSQKFSRVKKVELTDDYKSWTFYSYLKRAAQTFGPKGDRILPQARNFKQQMKGRVRKAIVRAHARHKSQVVSDAFGNLSIETPSTSEIETTPI